MGFKMLALRCSPVSILPPATALPYDGVAACKAACGCMPCPCTPIPCSRPLLPSWVKGLCENVCCGLTLRWFACCDDAYSVMSLRMISLTRASSPAAASCLTRCSTSRAASLRRSYLRDRAQQQCSSSVAACTHVAACLAAMHGHVPCKKRSRCCFSQFVAYLAQHRLRQQLLGDHHGDVPCCCDRAAGLR